MVFDHGLDEAAEPKLHTAVEIQVKHFMLRTWKRLAVQPGGSGLPMLKTLEHQGVSLNPVFQDNVKVTSVVDTATVRFGTVIILTAMFILVVSRRWFFLA